MIVLAVFCRQLSLGVATDLFKLFDGRTGDQIARNKELILAFSMVRAYCGCG